MSLKSLVFYFYFIVAITLGLSTVTSRVRLKCNIASYTAQQHYDIVNITMYSVGLKRWMCWDPCSLVITDLVCVYWTAGYYIRVALKVTDAHNAFNKWAWEAMNAIIFLRLMLCNVFLISSNRLGTPTYHFKLYILSSMCMQCLVVVGN